MKIDIPTPPPELTPLTSRYAHFLHETMDLRTPTMEGNLGLYFLGLLSQSPQYENLGPQYMRLVKMQNERTDCHALYQSELHRLEMILAQAPWESLPGRVSAMAHEMGKLERRKPPLPTTMRDTISWDQRRANYHVFKWLMDGAAPITWEDFCEVHELHLYLRESKKFRQHLFGLPRFHPQVQATWQHIFTTKLARRLEAMNMPALWVLHDELACPLFPILPHMQVTKVDPEVAWRYRFFKDTPLTEGGFLRIVGGEDAYKTLVSVPGSNFVPMFVKYVLEKEVREIDRVFKLDGKLAMWVDQGP